MDLRRGLEYINHFVASVRQRINLSPPRRIEPLNFQISWLRWSNTEPQTLRWVRPFLGSYITCITYNPSIKSVDIVVWVKILAKMTNLSICQEFEKTVWFSAKYISDCEERFWLIYQKHSHSLKWKTYHSLR